MYACKGPEEHDSIQHAYGLARAKAQIIVLGKYTVCNIYSRNTSIWTSNDLIQTLPARIH